MIYIKKVDNAESVFPNMMLEGFGEYNGEIPAHIYMTYDDDKLIGFSSVYAHSRGNLYLQYIGFKKEIEKKYYYFAETVKALHNLGFQFIMGAIESKNKLALLWGIRAGFEIIGTRQATDGTLYVEVIKEK